MKTTNETKMTNLSPAAKAVLDAALETDFEIDFTNLDATLKASMKTVAAAALRAVADQVVPETKGPRSQLEYELGDWDARDDMRNALLAIADEREAQ